MGIRACIRPQYLHGYGREQEKDNVELTARKSDAEWHAIAVQP